MSDERAKAGSSAPVALVGKASAISQGQTRDGSQPRTQSLTLAKAWSLYTLPALTGAAIAAAFLDFRLYPLAWVAFVPLLWSLSAPSSRREALAVGFAAGLATNVPAFYWLIYTIHVFGGFPYPVAAFFYVCLSLYSACQFVLFALLVRRFGFGPLGLAVPVFWVALEFLYPNLFPWRMANSQFHFPLLIQIGDVTGPFGLSFAILWVNAGVLLALRQRRWGAIAGGLASTGLILVYGAARMPTVQAAIDAAPSIGVGLVQGNVGIVEKGNVAFFDINLEKYRGLSRPLQSEVDLLIWPETVSQTWVSADALQVIEDENPFPGLRTFLIYGGLAYRYLSDRNVEKHNSAFLIGPHGRIWGRYDKRILMPFGEYLPGASLIPGLADWSPQTGDFTPGRSLATLDVPEQVRIAPLICYEDVPASIARSMTRNGAEALLTIFNDAWFGRSMAPYQHEALALWRAIENRRYFMRVGNAGVTSIVDPFGRIVERLGLFTEETLAGEIRSLRIETFYTRHGDLFAWAVVLVAVAWIIGRRTQTRI
jgi:apolipoprotein N-acyltransferase